MRINSVGNVVAPESKYARSSQKIKGDMLTSGVYDSLQISSETMAINSIISAAKSVNEVDFAKVDALRQQIAGGTYMPNSNTIVAGILMFK